jgi:type IV pilus assembly protein PilB
MHPKKLGEILAKQGLVRPDQLQQALVHAKNNNLKLGTAIIALGFLKDSQILRALEKQFAVPGIDVAKFEVDQNVLTLLQKDFCERNMIIPISKAGTTLVVAFSDPTNLQVRDDLRFITKCKIQPVVATESSISVAIDKFYGAIRQSQIDINKENLDDVVEAVQNSIEVGEGTAIDAPIVKFVNGVLIEAIKRRASDIHFEPYEKKFRVRIRIDGNLIETAAPPTTSGNAICARIKIMSKMDIAERRRPQDGRLKIQLKNEGREMDFRVNTIPTMWGEKVVMRLLDKNSLQLDMTKLGFEPEDLKVFKDVIQMPQGMVLITGPTGSGKTVTIYSALFELNKTDVNISTAEDPIEFNLEGINQVQMNSEIDLNFSSALRAFLRQDPDIIMVGEIRDLETAEISFKAASTGHLVVSTLHTNDAPTTVTRLTEMGIAPYLITSTLNLVVAQRLLGKNCESCKEQIRVPEATLINLGVEASEISKYNIFKGKGCITCNNTGIKGRIAIFELMPITEKIKELILANASAAELRNACRQLGFKTLRRSALLKLSRGETTIEEVLNSSVRDNI